MMARPSVGCSPQHQFLGKRPLRRCQNRVEEDNIVLIDIESHNCENVVVIDIPDSFPTKFGGGSESSRRGKKAETSWASVICLDDDDDDDDDDEDTDDSSDEDCVISEVNVNNNSSFSRKSNPPASGNSGSLSDTNLDGCQSDQENATPLKLSKGKRTYSGKTSAENHFGVYDVDDLSCDDFIDCDLMEDSCGSVKEMWEKANSKRKCDPRNGRPAQGDFNKGTYDACSSVNTSTDCGQCEEPPSMTKQAKDEGEDSSIHKNKGNLDYTADEYLNATHDGVEDGLLESILNGMDTHYTRRSSFDFAECYNSNFPEPNNSDIPSMEEQNLKEKSSSPCLEKDTEQVNHANKPFHDTTEVPLRDSCLSRSESSARENVCDREKTNLFHRASLYNQSVDSELGHGRFCSADQNGSFPEENRSPSFQRDPNCTSSSHEKSIRREVHVETFSNKSSVCFDETSIWEDSIQFDMEQIDVRSSIFRSDMNEVLSVNNPNKQDDQTNDSVHDQDDETAQNNEFFMISDREKLKETEEYKKATEEEWASRKQALQIQAEEAQNLRRLRKRMKAQTMRIVDMEKRQKQRLEEIRETEKKDQENSNLRDIIRAEVRSDLNKLEATCFDMATLLRRLGIPVGGGGGLLPPLLSEVRAAYKRAILTFHPDRASRTDLRQQVEAEEKFKLISRMKERFLSSL